MLGLQLLCYIHCKQCASNVWTMLMQHVMTNFHQCSSLIWVNFLVALM